MWLWLLGQARTLKGGALRGPAGGDRQDRRELSTAWLLRGSFQMSPQGSAWHCPLLTWTSTALTSGTGPS